HPISKVHRAGTTQGFEKTKGACRIAANLEISSLGQMIDSPYRTVAVASTFSPRFLQVLAEAKRIRDRLASQLHLIYVGKRDEETTGKFSSALRQLDLPVDSTIYYHQGDPASAILEAARANAI